MYLILQIFFQINRLLVAVWAFFCLLVSVTSNNHLIFQNNNPVRLCGPILSDVVAVICDLNYAKKKNVPLSEYDDQDTNMAKLSNLNSIVKDLDFSQGELTQNFDFPQRKYQRKWRYPVKSRMSAYSMVPRRFRRQAGIVEECCDKPCFLNELRSYCAVG